MPRRGVTVVWLALTAAALVIALAGSSPMWLAVLALGAWTMRLAPRWGIGAALALSLLTGGAGVFVVMTLAPMTPVPFQIWVSLGLASATLVAALRPRLGTLQRPETMVGVAAATGAGAWAAGLLIARLVPGSSARSWAVLDDSTLDLWNIRHYADYNGFPLVLNGNPRPYEHVLSTAFLPWGAPLDGGGAELAAGIGAHAGHWSLVIMAGCLLAGLVAAELTRGAREPRPWAIASIAAVSSLMVLAGPATGFFVLRGQINASIVVATVLASVAVSLRASTSPPTTIAALFVGMTLLLLTWTPFAAVPGVLLLHALWRHRSDMRAMVRARGRRSLAVPAAGATFFLWAFTVIGLSQFLGLAAMDGEASSQAVSVPTFLPAPYSYTMTALLLATTVVVAVLDMRAPTGARATVLLGALGLVIGGIPLFLARGGFAGELEYYPSRYLQMATICLVPLVLGVAGGALVRSWRSVASGVAVGGLVVTAVVAAMVPLSPRISRWVPAPALVVAGDYYGPDDALYSRALAYADEADGVRLPWNLERPWDDKVRYLLTIDEEDRNLAFSSPARASLRNLWEDDSVDRICDIALAHDEPLVIETADTTLEDTVRNLCDAAEIENVTFVLLTN